jgi:hypothetical protein
MAATVVMAITVVMATWVGRMGVFMALTASDAASMDVASADVVSADVVLADVASGEADLAVDAEAGSPVVVAALADAEAEVGSAVVAAVGTVAVAATGSYSTPSLLSAPSAHPG